MTLQFCTELVNEFFVVTDYKWLFRPPPPVFQPIFYCLNIYIKIVMPLNLLKLHMMVVYMVHLLHSVVIKDIVLLMGMIQLVHVIMVHLNMIKHVLKVTTRSYRGSVASVTLFASNTSHMFRFLVAFKFILLNSNVLKSYIY